MKNTREGSASAGRAARALLYTVLTVLVVGCLWLIAESILPGDRMPGTAVLKPAAEKNTAMEPTVRRGDFVMLSPMDGQALSVDTVVSYRTDEGFVLGRIIGADGGIYLIRGDAADAKDFAAVRQEDIRAVWNGFRIPLLGYLIIWAQSAPGIVLLVVAVVLLDFLISAAIRRRLRRSADFDAEAEGVAFSLCGLLVLAGGLVLGRLIHRESLPERRRRK